MNNTVVLKKDSQGKAWVELDGQLPWIIVESLRYEYGRHTIATGDTARWLNLQLLDKLSNKVLYVIYKDIEAFKERRETFGPSELEIYENDVAPFLDLQKKVMEILAGRGYEVDARCGRMLSVDNATVDYTGGDRNSDKGDVETK